GVIAGPPDRWIHGGGSYCFVSFQHQESRRDESKTVFRPVDERHCILPLALIECTIGQRAKQRTNQLRIVLVMSPQNVEHTEASAPRCDCLKLVPEVGVEPTRF